MFQPLAARTQEKFERPLQTPLASDKPRRTFEERHIRVARSARFAMLGSLDARLREVWIVCHGHAQLARRFVARFLPLERSDRLFVAPEALSRFYLEPPRLGPHSADVPVGASWMTYEDRDAEITDYVGYLDLVHDEIFSVADRSQVRLVVFGFSQGVATVVRWLTRGKAEPDRVILWAGMLPAEIDAAAAKRLSGSPVTVVLGTKDQFARPDVVAQQEARLRELGIAHDTVRFDGGHEINPEVLVQLAEGVER
jgi:predicted esterase